ncbi:MAG: ATPase domain-containing protein [Candidatus Aenigmatarchaeota archaeon]
MKVERVESGIPGLDKLIEGGFVKGSVNLIAGTTGTGKSIFGCQFILHGLRKGENGIYICLEQSVDDLLLDMSKFGWDKEFMEYMKEEKLKIEHVLPTSIKKLTELIFNKIEKINAKRLVIDSITVAAMGWEESGDISKIRRELFDLIQILKKRGVTSLLIAEVPETEPKALSKFGFEEFVVDSVIILHYLEYTAGGASRSLVIRKMRRTNHGVDVYPIKITERGIVVKEDLSI